MLLLRTQKSAQTGPDHGGGSTESAPTQQTGLPTAPCPGRREPLRIFLPEMYTSLEVNRTDNYKILSLKKMRFYAEGCCQGMGGGGDYLARSGLPPACLT